MGYRWFRARARVVGTWQLCVWAHSAYDVRQYSRTELRSDDIVIEPAAQAWVVYTKNDGNPPMVKLGLDRRPVKEKKEDGT